MPRWAKVFNLKQMAQTMNYLSENNLLEYAVLEEKAAAATAHHNDLSAQIKAAEKRMAEIAVLRTHIVNYAKTRETYVAYRKAGYSRKFREEHEEEILLHQAAKNAFDEMDVKKLPKDKELQTEYAKLLEEKKKTYAEYRRSREEMRELLMAKANVDRVLKMEVEQDVEKKRPRPAVSWSWSKAFAGTGHPGDVRLVPTGVERRPRSHRMKFCVQRGLGALPSTSKRRGKSQRDFLLCGPVCINTGIACRYYP